MHILIYNPLARGNRGKESLDEAIHELNIEKYEVFSLLDLNNNLVETLATYPKDHTIILIGGDGTLNKFINKYKNAPIAQKILYYAGGTGNDFKKNFSKAKSSLFDISEHINKLKVEIKDSVFNVINAIGAGIDGLVVKKYHDSKKIRKFTYILRTVQAFFVYKPTDVKLILDGQEHIFEKCWLVSINNGKYFGSGMKVAPMALVDDGLLDVCVVHGINKMNLIRYFISIFRGKHLKYTKYIFYRQAKTVEYISRANQYIQYDGELVKDQTNNFKVAVE